MENLWTIPKDNESYKQQSSAKKLEASIKDICNIEITQDYCE